MISDIDLLLIFSTIVILAVVLMLLFIYVYFLKQKSRLIIENKEKALHFEQQLSLSQIEMKEQTLNFVGQELHDEVGQKISVAMMLAAKVQKSATEAENEEITEIRNILGECIRDIRDLSRTFVTRQIEHMGLTESIKTEVERVKRLDFVTVNFHYNNFDIDIRRKDSLILFRIVQECLHNSLKHSKAKNIEISLIDSEEYIKISVEDNGIGIEKPEITDSSSLVNMKIRAEMINAELHINGSKNVGTAVTIHYKKP